MESCDTSSQILAREIRRWHENVLEKQKSIENNEIKEILKKILSEDPGEVGFIKSTASTLEQFSSFKFTTDTIEGELLLYVNLNILTIKSFSD